MKKQILFISFLLSTSIYAVNFRENNSVIQRKTLIVNQLNELEKVHANLSESDYKKKYKNWKNKIKGLSKKVCVRNGDCTIGTNIDYVSEIKATITPYFERNGEVIKFPNLAFPVHAKVLKKKQVKERVVLIQDMYTLTDFNAYSNYKIERRRIYDDYSDTDVYTQRVEEVRLGDDSNAIHSVAFRVSDDSVYFDRGYFSVKSQEVAESDFVYIENGAMYSTRSLKLSLKPHRKFNNSEDVESVDVEVLFRTSDKMNYTFNKVIGDGIYQKQDDLIYLANEDFSVDSDFSYEVQPDEGFAAMYIEYGNSSNYWQAASDNKEKIVEFVKRYMPEGSKFDFEYRKPVVNGNVTTSYGTSMTGNIPWELGSYEVVDVFGQLSYFSQNKMVTGLDFGTDYIEPKYLMEFLAEQNSLSKLRGIKSKHYTFLSRLYDLMQLSSDTFGENQGFGVEEIIVPFLWFASMEEQRQYEPKLMKKYEGFKNFKYHRMSYDRTGIDQVAEQNTIRNSDGERLQILIINDYISDELMDHYALDELNFKLVMDHDHKGARKVPEDYFMYYAKPVAYLVCNDLLEDRYEKLNSRQFIGDLFKYSEGSAWRMFDDEEYDKELAFKVERLAFKEDYKSGSVTSYSARHWITNGFPESCNSSRSLFIMHAKYGSDDDYNDIKYHYDSMDVFPKFREHSKI